MSLQKERIGTTLTVVWEVLTNGDAVSLDGRDIRVFAIDPHKKRTEMTDLQIGGSAMDVVTCVFEGKEQEHPGIYQLECIENYNKPNQAVLDDDVIMLVPRSKQRTGGSIGLATPTIQLTTGTLWVGVKGKDGKSAYELAVADGYEGTVTEWLASLHGRDADIAAAVAATNAANAAAAAANDAAEDAEDATTGANTAASAANTAASSANAGEVVRQQNETQRNTNETNRQNAESQRQQTFQTNEAARQTAYQNAEANRNGAYQEAEEDRDETFNSKEATRDAANQAALNCAETLNALGPKIAQNEENISNLNAVVNGGETTVYTKIAEDSFMSNVTAGSQQFSVVSGKKYKVHCQSAEPLGQTQLRIYFRNSASDSAISDSYYANDADISQGVYFELTASATGTALLRISVSGVASAKTLNFEVYNIEEVLHEGILPKVETINGNIDTIQSNTDYLLKGNYAEQGKGSTFDSILLNESKVREGDTLLINVGAITCPDGASRGAVYLRSYTSDGTRVKNIEIGQNNEGSYTFAATEKIVRIYFFKSVSATSSTSFNYTASITAYWNQSLRGDVEKVKDDVESINTSISNLGSEIDELDEGMAGKVSRSELGTETSYTPVSPKELLEGKYLNSNGILATVASSSFYVYVFEVKAGDKFNIKGDEYSGASSVRWWSIQATENFSSTPLRVSSSTFANTIDETITIADGEKYLLVGSAYLSATGQTAHITKESEVLPITLAQVKNRLNGLTDFSILNMGVDGDSITEGNQWSYIASGILGCANHHNVGVGGATWACARRIYDGVTYTPQDYSDPNFAGFAAQGVTPTSAEQAQKQANNCAMVHVQRFIAEVNAGTYPVPDIFCFAFGANDNVPSSNDVEAVMAADYTSKPTGEMLYNLAGGMRWALQTIHEEYPNCRIFVMLPIQQAWVRGSVPANLKAYMVTKTEYIRRIAQDFSVQIVDMFHNCGIIGCLETTTGPYLRDGLHPNDAGRALMGKYAASQIRVLYF